MTLQEFLACPDFFEHEPSIFMDVMVKSTTNATLLRFYLLDQVLENDYRLFSLLPEMDIRMVALTCHLAHAGLLTWVHAALIPYTLKTSDGLWQPTTEQSTPCSIANAMPTKVKAQSRGLTNLNYWNLSSVKELF